jgi:hypothetical protein
MREDQAAGGGGDGSGLGDAEHLLVWTWRRLVIGQGACPLIARAFAESCGADAAETFATFGTFLRALAYAARRRLCVGHPGSAGLTSDERQILILIAAAQADDQPRFDAHLLWLARGEFRPAVTMAALALGSALAAHGQVVALAPPLRPAPAMAPALALSGTR